MKDAAVNKKPAPAGLLNIVKTYSFLLVFLVIYIVYASVSGGFALGAAMNVFRHSAVIGVIAIGMGIGCHREIKIGRPQFGIDLRVERSFYFWIQHCF